MSDVQIKQFLRQRLLHGGLLEPGRMERRTVRARIDELLDELVTNGAELPDRARKRVTRQVIDDVLGLGPLEPLMRNDDVTEILVNGHDQVFVEYQGQKVRAKRAFDDELHLRQILERLLRVTRTRLDEARPFVDISLADGTRINVVVPPVVTGGPHLTVRKYLRRFATLDDVLAVGSLDERMAAFLRGCVQIRRNLLLSGASGTGKTTLLELLAADIAADERLVVIEDTLELQLDQPNVARLLTRPPNIEGEGEITIRDLFRNSLRMRPDRILLGEIRGREAAEFLQALSSGHGGSLAVIHASSPAEAVIRLENLVPHAGVPVPVEVIRDQIAHGVDLVVQLDQLADGTRKLTRVSEVTGVGDDGRVALAELFRFVDEGAGQDGAIAGRFEATGARPTFLDRFALAGVPIDETLFAAG